MRLFVKRKRAERQKQRKMLAEIVVRKAKAKRDGKKFDEKADEQLKAMVIDYLEKLSHGLVASSMLTDDGIIDPRDTRDVIGFCLSIVSNNVIEGAKEYGVFRL